MADEYRKKAIDALWLLLGYNKTNSSTYIFKEISKYKDDYKLLYLTVVSNSKQIENALYKKTFASEIFRIKYVMAIIDNSIEAERIKYESREAKIKTMKTEEGYENLEDVSSTTKQKGKDISSLLGDDSWI